MVDISLFCDIIIVEEGIIIPNACGISIIINQRKVVTMDVLGMYLLQRVSNELTIQRNGSFENRFVAPIPDSTAARVTNEAYICSSKDVSPRVKEGVF